MPTFGQHTGQDLLCQEGEWRAVNAWLTGLWAAIGLPEHMLDRAHAATSMSASALEVLDDAERAQHAVRRAQQLACWLMHEISMTGLNPVLLFREVEQLRAAVRRLHRAGTVGALIGEQQSR